MEDSERKKTLELLKEMRNENGSENAKASGEENRLNWMYKGPADLIDREEYLLGKSIDKSFEILNSGGNIDACLGRTSELSNVPKRLLEKTDSVEQVDIAKKILEDPLYAIKQKELEARKKLLHNPVKLKQIKQMLLMRNLKNECQTGVKQSKIEKLDFKIMQKLKKFNDKMKKKALKKVLKSSSYEDTIDNENKKDHTILKKSKKRKRKTTSEDSFRRVKIKKEKESEIGNFEKKNKHNHDEFKNNKKEKHGRTKVLQKYVSQKKYKRSKDKYDSSTSDLGTSSSNTSSDSSSDSSSDNSSDSSSLDSSSSNSSSASSSSGETKKKKSKYKKSKSPCLSSDIKAKSDKNKSFKRIEKRKKKKSDSDSSKDSNAKNVKKYGLMVPKESKSVSRYSAPVKKYEKHVENKSRYISTSRPKVLSEKEREKKLKEMMENAKHRKKDRERNLERHRKSEKQEEENKTYDADFLRRQTSYFTSQGTMADRIKSNVNNIQRSNFLMDRSFVRK